MKRLSHVLFVAGMAAMPWAAQAAEKNANFTGFGAAVSVAYTHNKIEYGEALAGYSSSKNDARFGLDVSYGIPVYKDFITTIGATVDLNSTRNGTITHGADTGSSKLKEHWSVYLAPGVRVAPKVLVYAKLGYHGARTEVNDSLYGVSKLSHSGFGYGAGASFAVNRNLETSFELQQVDFKRKSTPQYSAKPSFFEVTWRVGGRF